MAQETHGNATFSQPICVSCSAWGNHIVAVACGLRAGRPPVVGVEQGNSDEPARYRRTRAGWSKTSLTGEPLTLRSLSSALTRTASYQMTICAIKQADYLLRRIRDERDPLGRLLRPATNDRNFRAFDAKTGARRRRAAHPGRIGDP
jgi:hypothetical protein